MSMSEILKETTVWDCDFQANHTYLLDNKGKIIAHAVHGGDKIMISKSGNIKLDKRYRTFVRSNHSGLAKLIKTEKPAFGVRVFLVKSKEKQYTVELSNSAYSCSHDFTYLEISGTCTGYNFRGKCKHITAVAEKQQLPISA